MEISVFVDLHGQDSSFSSRHPGFNFTVAGHLGEYPESWLQVHLGYRDSVCFTSNWRRNLQDVLLYSQTSKTRNWFLGLGCCSYFLQILPSVWCSFSLWEFVSELLLLCWFRSMFGNREVVYSNCFLILCNKKRTSSNTIFSQSWNWTQSSWVKIRSPDH